jgi:hypothetical protein
MVYILARAERKVIPCLRKGCGRDGHDGQQLYTHVKPVVLTVASFSDTTWIREQLV